MGVVVLMILVIIVVCSPRSFIFIGGIVFEVFLVNDDCIVVECSQEVVRCSAVDVAELVLFGRRVELQERVLHELVDFHDGRLVTATVAVVGRREDGDDIAVVRPVVAVHDELMGSGDELQVVRMVELLRDVLAERVAGTTRRDTPAASVIGVGPEEIADGTLVRNFHEAVELSNLVESVDAGRETTVEAEDVTLDDRSQRQVVKQLREVLPHVGVAILAQALVIEAVHLRDLLGLVVTAQNGDTVRVAHLHAHEKRHGLDRVVATIDVVTHEQVVVVGQLTADFEQLHEVPELAVDVTANGHGGAHRRHVGLFG